MSSPQTLRLKVAAEIRAEMARQRKTGIELASLLDLSQQSASRRVNGETDIDLDELEVIAGWLGVDVPALLGMSAA